MRYTRGGGSWIVGEVVGHEVELGGVEGIARGGGEEAGDG